LKNKIEKIISPSFGVKNSTKRYVRCHHLEIHSPEAHLTPRPSGIISSGNIASTSQPTLQRSISTGFGCCWRGLVGFGATGFGGAVFFPLKILETSFFPLTPGAEKKTPGGVFFGVQSNQRPKTFPEEN